MRGQVRSELRKIASARATWGLLAGMVALVALGVVEPLTSAPDSALRAPHVPGRMLAAPTALVVTVFTVVLGLRSFTDEFGHGTIVPTFLARPTRLPVLAAKLVAVPGTALLFSLAAAAVAVGIGIPWLAARGAELSGGAGAAAALTGKLALVGTLWSAIGVGVGLAVKHQVPAIVGTLTWFLVVELLLGALGPGVERVLPGAAARSLVSTGTGVLGPAAAALVLAAWAMLALAVGGALMQRRDVV